MLDIAAINSLKNSGFRVNNNSYVKELEELHIVVNAATIVVTNKETLEADVYEYNESNLLSVINTKASKEESTPLDLPIPSRTEEGNLVNSEIKNRVLVKMDDEFMSQPITVDDCKNLGFKPFDDGLGLPFDSITFFYRESIAQFFVLHQGLNIKGVGNPTRKQVDEVYHFFTGEHLDFSPKQKVYNWETCFSGNGWYMDSYGNIFKNDIKGVEYYNKNVYPTAKDAEAASAHCQLLHIVNKINEDYPKVSDYDYQVFVNKWLDLDITNLYAYDIYEGLRLNSKEGAEILIRDNEELLKTYFKIK